MLASVCRHLHFLLRHLLLEVFLSICDPFMLEVLSRVCRDLCITLELELKALLVVKMDLFWVWLNHQDDSYGVRVLRSFFSAVRSPFSPSSELYRLGVP